MLGAIGDQSVDEGVELTFTATATDSDLPADTLTFSLDTASEDLGMTIDANTGVFSWTPTEAQGGSTPSVTITVTDDGTGTLFDSEIFTITANDTNTAPVITSDGAGTIASVTIAENQTVVTKVTSTDTDLPVNSLIYSTSGGADQTLFIIDPGTGVLSFVDAPDFEIVADADLDGIYEVEVQVSDSTDTDTQLILVTVTNGNELPSVALSGIKSNLLENINTSTRIKIADIDVTDDGLGSNALSLIGPDSVLFEIDGSELFLKAGTVVDFEVQNAYAVTVQVDDTTVGGTPDDEATLLVGVLDVNDAPILGNIETAAAAYTAGDAPVAVSLKLTVDDQDDTHIDWAVVKFTANYRAGEDILHFTDTATITGNWDASSGTLTLSGVDTVAAYQTALRSVSYENLNATPDMTTRRITFSVNDGEAPSNDAHRDVGLADAVEVDSPPVPVPELPDPPAPVTPPPVVEDAPVTESPKTESTVGDDSSDDPPTTASDGASGTQAEDDLVEPEAPVESDWYANDPVDSDDRDKPKVVKLSARDVLAKEVAAIIQSHAGMLEALAFAPKAAVLNSIVGALSIDELRASLNDSGFTRDLDRVQKDLASQSSLEQAVTGAAFVSSTSLAVGYVMWLFRGGALLSGFLSSMAAWQLADPLPVLAHALARKKGEESDDEDSLESLVREGSKTAREKRGKEDGGV